VQDALEVRVAHADLVHVVERVADVVDARPAHADALRDEARAAMQVELAHVRRMSGVREEGKGAHGMARAQVHRHELRRINAAVHFALPQAAQHEARARGGDAECHAPA